LYYIGIGHPIWYTLCENWNDSILDHIIYTFLKDFSSHLKNGNTLFYKNMETLFGTTAWHDKMHYQELWHVYTMTLDIWVETFNGHT
jgi:hypothetical protein